jgi:hypothetical protein
MQLNSRHVNAGMENRLLVCVRLACCHQVRSDRLEELVELMLSIAAARVVPYMQMGFFHCTLILHFNLTCLKKCYLVSCSQGCAVDRSGYKCGERTCFVHQEVDAPVKEVDTVQ